MISTEFFKTLAEAEAFQPCGVVAKEVLSLDKPGTINEFKKWRNDAIAYERYEEVRQARAVMVMYR